MANTLNCNNTFYTLIFQLNCYYSARRLIGSRIIESSAYCNQKLLAHLYLNSTLNTSVNWIIRLLLSLFCWPKVILLSGGHCIGLVEGYLYFSNIFKDLEHSWSLTRVQHLYPTCIFRCDEIWTHDFRFASRVSLCWSYQWFNFENKK